MAESSGQFTFEISLSILNHLGRNLYRSFLTVLGEAISNSWDADSKNVWIYIDRESNTLVIKDDGEGMDDSDFQNKFLKIGYSKRKNGINVSKLGRPFIGRKGIGKLALLSCAKRVSVLSKKTAKSYIGGIIDNSNLNEAIENDLTPAQYLLENINLSMFDSYIQGHINGTIIIFEEINQGIRNSIDHIKKIIALYFRFSIVEENFNIYVNNEKITIDNLDELAKNTQFIWVINDLNDPFVIEKIKKSNSLKKSDNLKMNGNIQGFIASVTLPSKLKIMGTDEKISIDLFVNGRLRERNILKHIPSARLVENYLYGQIHYNDLDNGVDRFTSSREGIVADDDKFIEFLESLKEIMGRIIEYWDKWRIEIREDGDPENLIMKLKERKAIELFNLTSKEFIFPEGTPNKEIIEEWVNSLADDAKFNFSAYSDCYVSENLLRKYMEEKEISCDSEKNTIENFRTKEETNKRNGNINIEIRQDNKDSSYLDMEKLAKIVDPQRGSINTLTYDAKAYKPIRDALAHTALLTNEAKNRLSTIYQNIKAKIQSILTT